MGGGDQHTLVQDEQHKQVDGEQRRQVHDEPRGLAGDEVRRQRQGWHKPRMTKDC